MVGGGEREAVVGRETFPQEKQRMGMIMMGTVDEGGKG